MSWVMEDHITPVKSTDVPVRRDTLHAETYEGYSVFKQLGFLRT
jgi:hypothetical protein